MSKVIPVLKISFFIGLAILILFIANLCVFAYLITIFASHSSPSFYCLAIVQLVLSLAFIGAIILDSKFNNAFLRTAHLITSVWMGFFVYLFLSSILLGFYIQEWFGLTLFALSILVGTYSLFHARFTQIKRIEIRLPNLPEAWKNRKVVFVSDLHLGHILKIGFAKKVANVMNKLSPDLILIGGDLYDGSKVDEVSIIKPIAELKPPLGTYFVTGNHEEFADNSHFLDAIRGAGIKVLNNAVETIDGLQLVGVTDHDSSDKEKFQKVMNEMPLDKSKPSILIKHQPNHLAIAETAGVSLQLSGHTHRAQLFPLNAFTKLLYKAYDYGLHMFGKMSVYTSSGVGTWGPPMRVGSDSEVVLITFIC